MADDSSQNSLDQSPIIGSILVILASALCFGALMWTKVRFKALESISLGLASIMLLVVTIFDIISKAMVLKAAGISYDKDHQANSDFRPFDSVVSDSAGYTASFIFFTLISILAQLFTAHRLRNVHGLFENTRFDKITLNLLVVEAVLLISLVSLVSKISMEIISIAQFIQTFISSAIWVNFLITALKVPKTSKHLARTDFSLCFLGALSSFFYFLGNVMIFFSLWVPWAVQSSIISNITAGSTSTDTRIPSVAENLRMVSRLFWVIALALQVRMYILRKYREEAIDPATKVLNQLMSPELKPKKGVGIVV